MSPCSSIKRIRILPETEIDDLFAVPNFNDDERLIWFELNQDEKTAGPNKLNKYYSAVLTDILRAQVELAPSFNEAPESNFRVPKISAPV